MDAKLAEARRGRLTASMFSTCVVGTPAAQRRYLDQLRREREGAEIDYQSGGRATEHGKDWEEVALVQVELELGVKINRTPGFIEHSDYPEDIGCSPDGIDTTTKGGDEIGMGVEVKCPMSPAVHQQHRLGQLADAYRYQVLGSMWVTGASVWVFASYLAPYLNGGRDDLFISIFQRDEPNRRLIAQTERAVLTMREHLVCGTNPEPFDPLASPVPRLFK